MLMLKNKIGHESGLIGAGLNLTKVYLMTDAS